MSHCKFEHPRHGHLGFRPNKRCRTYKPKQRCDKKPDLSGKPRFTAFPGIKVGMTSVIRKVNRPELKKKHGKEIHEAVTMIETPPCTVVGVRGYIESPTGLKCFATVIAQNLSEAFKRRLVRN